MNFRRLRPEEPEINLIPFIDVLLVILIFLMLSTTYSKFTELQVALPVADAEQARDRPHEIIVAVAADGLYAATASPSTGAASTALPPTDGGRRRLERMILTSRPTRPRLPSASRDGRGAARGSRI